MNIIQALILGIVQGLTELLPISSSAHLYLIPWMFNWFQNPNFKLIFDIFDVALHGGTFLAIIIFFFKDWINLIKAGFGEINKKEKSHEAKMFWYLVIATIPGAGIGFILDNYFEGYLENSIIIAIALIIMGVILYLVDRKAKSETEFKEMTFKQTFIIGVSQCLAFIPGVSRSGVTMTLGRFLGIKREAIAKYSFLLSTPIVAGATIYKMLDFLNPTFRQDFIETGSLIPFIIGVSASFIIGILVIKFLLEYLKKGNFKIFAIYRIVLGIIVVIITILK